MIFQPSGFQELLATKKNVMELLSPGSFKETTMVEEYLVEIEYNTQKSSQKNAFKLE